MDGRFLSQSPGVRSVLLLAAFPLLLASLALGLGTTPTGEDALQQMLRGEKEDAVAIAEEALSRDPGDARAACCLVELLHSLRRVEEADSTITDFETRNPESGIVPLARGVLAYRGLDFAGAESLFSVALAKVDADGDQTAIMVTREQIAKALGRLNRWSEAYEQGLMAMELAEELEVPASIAFLHYFLGNSLKERSRREGGDLADQAATHLEEAIRQASTLDLPLVEAEAQLTLSIITRWQRDLDRTVELRKAALKGFERVGHVAAQADCLQRIAAIQQAQGDFTNGTRNLQRAWALAEQAGSGRLVGYVIITLANTAYITGDFDRGKELLPQAFRVAEEIGIPELMSMSLYLQGSIATEEGQFEDALRHFEAALEISRGAQERRGIVRILNNIGWCLYKKGDLEGAIARLEEARTAAQEIGDVGTTHAYLLRDIGTCRLKQQRWEEAERSLHEAEGMAVSMGMPSLVANIRFRMAQSARAQGHPTEALALLDDAMAVDEGIRARLAGTPRIQSGFFGSRSAIYEEAVDLLHSMHESNPEMGHDRKAFDVVQRAKARTFLDLLREAEVDLRSRADARYQTREQEILGQISKLMRPLIGGTTADSAHNDVEIARLENELAVLESELREADPRYAELRYPQPSTLDEVQGTALQDGELLIEYLLADSASYLWAVTSDSFRFVKLPKGEEIADRVAQFLPLLQDYNILGSDPTYFIAAAGEVSEALIRPIAEGLMRARRMVVVPHGILHYLPFEALLLDTAGSPTEARQFGDLPYLVNRLDVTYSPSVSALVRLRASTSRAGTEPAKDLLLLGDPVLPEADELSVFAHVAMGSKPAPLPFVAEEFRGLRQLFGEDRCFLLQGEGATSANLRSAQESGPFRLVHFATHGVFNERRPQYSGLILSPEEAAGDDGFLTIGEIFGLDLECEQVTLSACVTALGEEITGEGIVGLSRAFQFAGARSVVAALWEVAGETTSAFMQRFYGGVAEQEAEDRSHALAQAKRWCINGGEGTVFGDHLVLAHPYFWAPFVMAGEGRSR